MYNINFTLHIPVDNDKNKGFINIVVKSQHFQLWIFSSISDTIKHHQQMYWNKIQQYTTFHSYGLFNKTIQYIYLHITYVHVLKEKVISRANNYIFCVRVLLHHSFFNNFIFDAQTLTITICVSTHYVLTLYSFIPCTISYLFLVQQCVYSLHNSVLIPYTMSALFSTLYHFY